MKKVQSGRSSKFTGAVNKTVAANRLTRAPASAKREVE